MANTQQTTRSMTDWTSRLLEQLTWHWDHQLRQPVLLAHDNMVVSVSPQDQYVHQVSPLDTLGIDEVAAERSIDPSAATNGASLGCSEPARFVPPFAAALEEGEVGELTGPVESDFGFHVILVRARGDIFDEVAPDIRAQLEADAAPGNALGAWLQDAIASADVSISSRYGSWSAETGEVLPPEGPAGETPTLNLLG